MGTSRWLKFDNPWLASAFVLVISLAILVGFTVVWGTRTKFRAGADEDQYLALARSLAAGNGYKNLVGPWPNLPDYSRMPGWPALIAVGLRIAPGANPESVSKITNAFCLSLAAAFFCALSRRLGVNSVLSVLAGLVVALSPSLVYFSVDGLSEVSFVMVLAMGLTALLAGGRWFYVGSLILGTASLIRANFILVPIVILALALLFRPARSTLFKQGNPFRAVVACMLVFAPALIWTIRNDLITGRFPFLSSTEGETFYGSNNPVVADTLEHWGYWVMPDEIPGERPKMELAQQLGTDLALNDYYHRKGANWIKANLRALPRLELGKFIRAFVPVPWVPLTVSYVAFSYRFLLYVFWFALLPFWWPGMNRTYLLFCLAMAVVHVITTAVFYGLYRFTHCYVEVLLIPAIMYGAQQWWTARHSITSVHNAANPVAAL